jgi:glycosyltransferase involved in cell wall biosynthesis
LDVGLRALASVADQIPDFRFAVLGEILSEVPLTHLVAQFRLSNRVLLLDHVSKSDFLTYLAATDIALNLRWPTMGETSASLLRLLAAGVPTIVSDVGAFREIPDDCCLKVPVDETEDARVAAIIGELANDSERRAAIGERAHAYVETHHSIERSAEGYVAAIERFLGWRAS